MKKKIIIITICLLVIIGIGLYLIHLNTKQDSKVTKQKIVLVKTQPVFVKNIPIVATTIGTLIAPKKTNISSETNGYVKQVLFTSGQHVNHGDKLIKLENTRAKADQLAAKAAYVVAKAKYTRGLQLRKKGFIAKQELELLYADMQSKLSIKQDATDTLSKKTIVVPFSGYLGARNINAGDYITSGQKLITLVNRELLKVEYSLPEKYFDKVKKGQRVNINVDSIPSRVFIGKVTFISPYVDNQTHTITLRATIANKSNLLAPGLFVTVKQILKKNVLAVLIPEQAVIKTLDQAIVFRVINGKAKSVPIKIGDLVNGNIQVLSGLKKGDVLITIGQNVVKDGEKVIW